MLVQKTTLTMASKKTILAAAMLIFLAATSSGNNSLDDFNQNRNNINRTGMWTLGSWAVGNFLISGIGWQQGSGQNMYFHQGNVMWNTVNLALAGFGLYGAYTEDVSGLGLHESIQAHYSMEKLLLFNAGLDVGYMAAGFYLRERSKNSAQNQDRYRGYGNTLILQGAFLFVLDLVLYAFHNRNAAMLENIIPSLNASNDGISVGLRIKL